MLQRTVELDTPTLFELEHGRHVTITLIDANHCPGAAMYVIKRLTVKHDGL